MKKTKETKQKKVKVMTKDQKVAKIAGNITHYSKKELVDKFLKDLKDPQIESLHLSSEKIRASKIGNKKVKVKSA